MSANASAQSNTKGKVPAIAGTATHATSVATPVSKTPAIAGVATQPAAIAVPASAGSGSPSQTDLFDLAKQIDNLLKGVSNKNVQKVLNMVGSLHGSRSISVDRPIGQPAAAPPTPNNGKKEKTQKAKGNSPAPAAYKQTPAWQEASKERALCVERLKRVPSSDLAAIAAGQLALRAAELKLKALKPAVQPGN